MAAAFAHDLQGLGDGAHSRVADHAGHGFVVACDSDDLPGLGRLHQGRE